MFRNFIIFALVFVSSVANAITIDDRLQDAAKIGNISEIKKLVKEGANVNATNKHGESPLLIATNWNKLDAVKTLLELGADPKYHIGGTSALFVATG
jgi:ankyrin repeat protein